MPALSLAVLLAQVCLHPTRADSAPIDWERVRTAPQRIRPASAADLEREAAASLEQWLRTLDEPVESGLPRATAVTVRRARMRLDRAIVIDDLARRPEGDVLFLASRADRRGDLIAAGVGLATPDVARALGVRAWPARIEPAGPDVVTIREGP